MVCVALDTHRSFITLALTFFLRFTSTWTIVYTTALWQSFTSAKASETNRCPVFDFDLLKGFLGFWLKSTERRQTVKNHRLLRKHSARIMSARHTTTADSERDLFCSLFFSFKSLFPQRRHNVPFFCLFPNPPSPQRRRHTHTPPLLPVKLQISPLETAAAAPSRPAVNKKADASPRVGPLLGGVVRSDDLGLRHHSVLILREGVAICEHNE